MGLQTKVILEKGLKRLEIEIESSQGRVWERHQQMPLSLIGPSNKLQLINKELWGGGGGTVVRDWDFEKWTQSLRVPV
jgi:hypothetical protein